MRILNQLWAAGLAAALWMAASVPARAVVVIIDGFGDADLNNNGVPLEAFDVDINGSGKGTPGDSWQPVQSGGNPTIFPAGTMVQEITAFENAADRGIPWYFTAGFTTPSMSNPTGDPKVSAKIISDAAGYLPDTNPAIGFTSNNTPGQVTVAAINTGLALSVESKGRNSSVAAFFDEDYSNGNQGRVSLGSQVGDKVKVSFDFRVWMSAPNFNAQSEQHVPTSSEIRFGLFQDTDNQLGMTNPTAGVGGNTPAVWGQAGGLLRGGGPSPIGGDGDHGWFARVQIEDPDEESAAFKPLPNGAGARIVEELNDSATAANRVFMSGSDADTVATPNQTTPNFVNMNYRKVYNLALTLERITDPDAAGTANAVRGTLEVTDRATQTVYTLSNFDRVGVAGTNDPDGGFESDSWDYFAMTTDGGVDEIDWMMDNFMVEIIGSNEPAPNNNADFNNDNVVDGRDFLIWQSGFGLTGQSGKTNGNANTDTVVDALDFAAWKAKFGGPPTAAAAGTTVPEPATGALVLAGLLAGYGFRRRGLLGWTSE